MERVCEKEYPNGLTPASKVAGYSMDGFLKENIDVLVRNNHKDMTWLGLLYSSTLAVGTGKSTLAQQIGSYYTSEINRIHNCNNTWGNENIFFRGKKLMEAAMKFPKYSVLVLDEGDDMTDHHMKALSKELKRFFNKFRQLNLFIIIIIPDLFSLPPTYAVQRSIFAIDVKFTGEFDRGFFSFYNFQDKRKLYNYGRKDKDYGAHRSTFSGNFYDGYTVDAQEYRANKLKDFTEQEKEEEKPEKNKWKDRVRAAIRWITEVEGYTQQEVADALRGFDVEISRQTISEWVSPVASDGNINYIPKDDENETVVREDTTLI